MQLCHYHRPHNPCLCMYPPVTSNSSFVIPCGVVSDYIHPPTPGFPLKTVAHCDVGQHKDYIVRWAKSRIFIGLLKINIWKVWRGRFANVSLLYHHDTDDQHAKEQLKWHSLWCNERGSQTMTLCWWIHINIYSWLSMSRILGWKFDCATFIAASFKGKGLRVATAKLRDFMEL